MKKKQGALDWKDEKGRMKNKKNAPKTGQNAL